MRRRGVRIALLISTLALQAGAVYKLLETDQRVAAVRLQLDRAEAQMDRALSTSLELRSALQAYVAPGQGEAFWSRRATELLQALDARIAAAGDGSSSDAAASLAVAGDQARSLRELDTRLRGLLAQGDRLMAADLAYGEVQEEFANLGGQLEETRRREAAARERETVALRTVEFYFLAASLGIGFVALLLLLPAWRPASAVEADATAPAGGLGLARTPLPATRAGAEVSLKGPGVSAADLTATARLCSDLGRVADAAELPPILGRAATAIGASGVIVWVKDAEDGSLRPVAGHGYPSEALARIGAVPIDADNATAAACRSGRIESVPAGAASPGALAVPMITASGCVGVMAAEVKAGRESDEATRALASIVAAQLATLVLPIPAGPEA